MLNQIWKVLKNADRGSEIIGCTVETPQWPRISTAYLGLTRLHYPYLLRLRSGEHIRLEGITDLKTFWQIFLRRVYRVRATDRVILDVGANIGLFTLYAARFARHARVFSFEPFPATFSRLLATVHDHHLDTRVTCLNYAATGAGGVRVMRDGPVPSQRRALASPSNSADGIQVQGKSLEEILDENDLFRVDLLKMDIEGSEYEVLLSAPPHVLKRFDRIALEYHGDSAPYSKQQLFDYLRQAGFTATWDVCDGLGYGVTEMILQN